MNRLCASWLLGIVTLAGFGSSVESVNAQTTYTFNATYDRTSALLRPITEDITVRSISGLSNDAPYGLTKASGFVYVETNPSDSSYRYSTNPQTFGLQNLPLGGVTLFGEGSNKLFYQFEDGVGVFNPEALTTTSSNTNKITGGEGLFEGATGTLTGSEVYQVANLLVDPTSALLRNSENKRRHYCTSNSKSSRAKCYCCISWSSYRHHFFITKKALIQGVSLSMNCTVNIS